MFRFLLILAVTTCDAKLSFTHKMKQQHVLAASVATDTDTSTRADPPGAFPGAAPLTAYSISEQPQLYYDAANGNAIRAAGVVVAGVAHGPWSGYTLVMRNLPLGGALNTCANGGIAQVAQCGGFINHEHNGMYIWATANPVLGGGGWACPANPTHEVYVGQKRADGGVQARCRDYNPNALTFDNVGSHQRVNFQAALNACKCLYHKHYHYGNAAMSYIIEHDGGAVPVFGSAGHIALRDGRARRGDPSRQYRFQPQGASWKTLIDAEEKALYCEAAGVGAWRFPWNVAGRPGVPPCI